MPQSLRASTGSIAVIGTGELVERRRRCAEAHSVAREQEELGPMHAHRMRTLVLLLLLPLLLVLLLLLLLLCAFLLRP